MIANFVNMVALSFELLGAFFLANHYLKVRARLIPGILLSAIFKGPKSKVVANLSKLLDDDPIVSLRGLGLLALGFAIQFILNFVQFVVSACELHLA